MRRNIISINEKLCNGCGACVEGCHEGALQMIDGKARIVSELYCDGLGACIGDCPVGAITIEEREAEAYDEMAVMQRASKGENSKIAIKVATNSSELTQWPIQLRLLNPQAGYLSNVDLILAADCTAYSYPDFHQRLLKGRKLAIACPKLDIDQNIYVEKLVEMIDLSHINTLTVAIMEVPCCRGLVQIARMAVAKSKREIPLKEIIIGIQGDIIKEN